MKPLTLYEFIENNRTLFNAYVVYPGFESLYVRKGYHRYKGQAINTLDIANIAAKKPGSGAFGRLIADLVERYPTMPIYVECVHNPRFDKRLLAMGFEFVPIGELNCYMLNGDGKFPEEFITKRR